MGTISCCVCGASFSSVTIDNKIIDALTCIMWGPISDTYNRERIGISDIIISLFATLEAAAGTSYYYCIKRNAAPFHITGVLGLTDIMIQAMLSLSS